MKKPPTATTRSPFINLLNLPDWNIEHVEDSARDYRVHATYGPEPSSCIHCAGKLYRHGTRERLLMDLPSHGKRVGILLTQNRYRCQDCGKTSLQPLPDVDERSQMTRRLVRYIEELRKTFTATVVADDVGVDEKTVRNLFKSYVQRLAGQAVAGELLAGARRRRPTTWPAINEAPADRPGSEPS